ncbi:MAG: hypothetical protein R6V35_02525 [Candidatus Nanohaloarchaea archaeon]
MKININGLETGNAEFNRPKPYFAMHETSISMLQDLEEDFENLVVIGNGGSVTSFRALNYAFRDEHSKNVEIITTMEPGYLKHVERSLDKEDTLVMPISKSGNTTGVIESTLFFLNRGYDIRPLTSRGGLLHEISEKKDIEIIEHPDIGGRFTGLSETALAPASLLGLDVEEIFNQGRKAHERFWESGSDAQVLAEALYQAEGRGFNEVLTPFYSTRLFGFYPLLVQLMHESVCKRGEGQTFYGDLGPEYQHHTNQRMFGGRENVIPIFIESSHEHQTLEVDEELRELDLRGRKLGDLDGQKLENSLNAEASGVKKALRDENRPFIELKIEEVSYGSIGEFMALLQFLSVYSGWIRDVNPFNQPDVEKSKELGFEQRFK